MAQQVIKINGRTIHQPDTFKFSFATTSTEGTERLMSGVMCNEPMFTVESYALVRPPVVSLFVLLTDTIQACLCLLTGAH